MLSILQQLLVAGNETTTKMLTEMVRLLAEHPDEWRRVQDDPARIDRVVEETLRLSTPTQGMFRIVTRDARLGDVDLPAGAGSSSSTARPTVTRRCSPIPDGFDPDRANLREHLAFGKGIHFCLGAALSRLEGRVALQELARRIDVAHAGRRQRLQLLPELHAARPDQPARRADGAGGRPGMTVGRSWPCSPPPI